MKSQSKIAIITLGLLVFLFTVGSVLAKDEVPTDTNLPGAGTAHLEFRGITFFNLGYQKWDGDLEAESIEFGQFFGLNNLGMKVGYLVTKNFDLGVHTMFSWDTFNTTIPQAGSKDMKLKIAMVNFRLAPYGNILVPMGTKAMMYAGGFLGFNLGYTSYEDENVKESKVEPLDFAGWLGIEAGLQYMPFKHVGFDIGGMLAISPFTNTVKYEAKGADDAKSDGVRVDFGFHGGIVLYF